MTTIAMLVVAVMAFVAGALLTSSALRYALRRDILDVPNERSSHSRATPRGGGIAIAITVLAAAGVLYAAGQMSTALAAPLLVGGGLVAWLGWLDDHRPLGVGIRASLHLVAAAIATAAVGFLQAPDKFESVSAIHWLTMLLYTVGIAWFINLYNFLDGIDGYAGMQAVCAGLAGAVLFNHGGDSGAAALCLITAGASAGFLVWNWSPARIFMGDVGSCFLGFLFGLLAVYGDARGVAPAWLWVVLIGVFFWDATFTLIRRVLAGEPWRRAHKSHAYQRLHQMGWPHARIVAGLLAINAFLLLPMVWAATVWNNLAAILTIASGGLLGGLWWFINQRFRAQQTDSPSQST